MGKIKILLSKKHSISYGYGNFSGIFFFNRFTLRFKQFVGSNINNYDFDIIFS